jgi:hypothetical protein
MYKSVVCKSKGERRKEKEKHGSMSLVTIRNMSSLENLVDSKTQRIASPHAHALRILTCASQLLTVLSAATALL